MIDRTNMESFIALTSSQSAYNEEALETSTNLVHFPASCDGQQRDLDELKEQLRQEHVGSSQKITSVVFHQPDKHLIETNELDKNRNSNILSEQIIMKDGLLSNKQDFLEKNTQHQQQATIESSLSYNPLQENSTFNNNNSIQDININNIFTTSTIEIKTTGTYQDIENTYNNNLNYSNNNNDSLMVGPCTTKSGQNISEKLIINKKTTDEEQMQISVVEQNKSPSPNTNDLEEEEKEDDDDDDDGDDESFVALCTDASSVLNNDPSRRYYINKLYQPLNGQNEDQLVDDEFLLYQELRYLESNAQKLTKDKQRVQLTRILEDDDGDDDQLDVRQQDEDPLDRLHMTTIIETFESFPTSPLVDNNISDPFNSGSCNQNNDHDHNQVCPDKPDSTIDNNLIGVCEDNATNFIISTTNDLQQNQTKSSTQHNNQKSFMISSTNTLDNQKQFYSTVSDENCSINDESQLINHQYQFEEYNYDDNISENYCGQKQQQIVAPTFVSSSYDNNMSNNLRVQRHSDDLLLEQGQVKKRNFKQISKDNIDLENKDLSSKKRLPNLDSTVLIRADETKISNNTCNYSKINPSLSTTTSDVTTSTNLNNINISKTNDYHEQHIIINNNDLHEKNDDEINKKNEMPVSSANNSKRNPHMSKYRRRTANARERIRMREINQAFEKLKKVVPVELIQQSMSGDESDHTSVSSRKGQLLGKGNQSQSGSSDSLKLTKITTLRLAVSYIAKLSEVLNQHQTDNTSDRVNLLITPSENSNQPSNISKQNKSNSTKKASLKKKKTKISPKFNSQDDEKLKNSPIEVGKVTENNQINNTKTVDLLNQQQYQQPIIIANQYQQNTSSGPLVTLRQQKPQQSTPFAQQCNSLQPSMTIPNGQIGNNFITTNQDRTYVTPVAVAILGIPTNNVQNSNGSHQGLQLLGIHGAHQQQTTQSYNLIAQHPQHVTLTLDDLNGLSVLRLANTNNNSNNHNNNNSNNNINNNNTGTISVVNSNNHNSNQTFQIQQNRPTTILHHQQAQILPGYNYTTYQPVQFSQIKPNTQPIGTNQQQPTTATIHFRNTTAAKISDNNIIEYEQSNRFLHNNQQQQIGSDKIMMIKSLEDNNNTTGIISDCRNYSISPTSNTIAQNLNNNYHNTTEQLKQDGEPNFLNQVFQQNYDSSGHSISQTTDTQNNREFFQNQQLNSSNITTTSYTNNPAAAAATLAQTTANNNNKTNLIYINPSTIMSSDKRDPATESSSKQQQEQTSNIDSFRINNVNGNDRNQFETIKFVAQFQHQDNNLTTSNTESNINQLVASLATSIQPKEQNCSNTNAQNSDGSLKQQQQQHQQQHKKTYRFHNYDGNMITNNLYGCHDRHQYNQNTNNINNNNSNNNNGNNSNKRCNQNQDQTTNPVGGGQRSRQNSLSSTCSTISSSSSLNSSSTSSPLVSIMLKSPTDNNDNENRNTSSTVSPVTN